MKPLYHRTARVLDLLGDNSNGRFSMSSALEALLVGLGRTLHREAGPFSCAAREIIASQSAERDQRSGAVGRQWTRIVSALKFAAFAFLVVCQETRLPVPRLQ